MVRTKRYNLPAFLILLLLLFSMSTFNADAQKNASRGNSGEMKKELREFKIKYLIQEMKLPADKQKEFAQIYAQMEEEREKSFQTMMQKRRELKKIAKPTDADYIIVVDAMADAKGKEAETERVYNTRLKNILTGEQLYKLKTAEHNYMKKVMEMKGKKEGRKNNKK